MAGPLTVEIAVPNVVTTSVPSNYVVAPNPGQQTVQLNGSVVGVGPDIAQLLKYRWYSDRYVAERYVDEDPDQSPVQPTTPPPVGAPSSMDAPLSLGRHALCLVASDAVGAGWATRANWVGATGGDSKRSPFVLHVVRAAWASASPPPSRSTPSTAIRIESGLLTGALSAQAPTVVWKDPPPPDPPRFIRAMVMGWAIRPADTNVSPHLIEWTETALTLEPEGDSNRRSWTMDLAKVSVEARRAAADALGLTAGGGPEDFELRLSCRDAVLPVSHLSPSGYFRISRPP